MEAPARRLAHIAVVCHSADRDVLALAPFWAEAVRVQMQLHVGPTWGAWAQPPSVFYYGRAPLVPEGVAGVIGLVDDGGVAAAAGYHEVIGRRPFGIVDLSRSTCPSRTLSHEALEMFRNGWLDEWLPWHGRPGWMVAAEICNPVQAQGYTVEAQVGTRREPVVVSDFVLPSWFGSSAYGWGNHLGNCAPGMIAPGGYQIARDLNDQIALVADGEGVVAWTPWKSSPYSRTRQIVAGLQLRSPSSSHEA